MREFRHFENVTTLALDRAACVGCGACVAVCPHAVLALDETGKARLADPGGCMECGACATNCAAAAITVRPGVGCAQAILNGWLSRLPFLRRLSGADSCCS
ncbi:4Fe-4S ferredoxin, iron-sulpur binding domain-containing protein [Desulfovibrio sp. X2]|uniref:mercury methylation ferredoxin HgcB n=1 Tax=Desulfovibrio sp. X2 TaxID=941449 RepID=UPI000358B224|nr:mercury methylation ferredoxin HgcB [Desulfovibrio sp. X2]EPR42827.1 4Fe-4S ferredoxin, iron-sulpur binding domain-containing protein [Desulfovibrio sp. X2]